MCRWRRKPETPGTSTSAVEVRSISQHGFWVLIGERELFLPFEEFPWFRDAPVGTSLNVNRPQPDHLYWPDLDVDLSVDSIANADDYPG